MALRAGVVEPVTGQCTTRVHEHSRGRQTLASAQCSLSFPVRKGTIRPAAAARRCRPESRTAACKPLWRSPALVPSGAASRLSVSCGTGIAQPGEVCCNYLSACWLCHSLSAVSLFMCLAVLLLLAFGSSCAMMCPVFVTILIATVLTML